MNIISDLCYNVSKLFKNVKPLHCHYKELIEGKS